MNALVDTPLQQLGRMLEDIQRRHDSHDVGGSAKGALTEKHDDRLMHAFHETRMALYGAVCDQRAETAADMIVQLYGAFVIADLRCNDFGDEPEDEDMHRRRAAIASALRVSLNSIAKDCEVPCRTLAESSVRIVFEPSKWATETAS